MPRNRWPSVTNNQMRALNAFILHSPDASPFTKKVLLWMLVQTKNLSRSVALSIKPDDLPLDVVGELRRPAADVSEVVGIDVDRMCSSNGGTRIDLATDMLNTVMCFSCAYGRYTSPVRYETENAPGWTVWICSSPYNTDLEGCVELLSFDADAILETAVSSTISPL